MSASPACTGAQRQLSVDQALENISQHDNSETETLQKEEETLSSLQATLSDVQKNSDEAEKKLRQTTRDLLFMEDDVVRLEQRVQAGRDQCASITAEHTKLLEQISEEEEKASMARAQFQIYRRKMEEHMQAVLRSVGRTDACTEEKRTLVQKVRKAKEELKEDLKNPHGIEVQSAKVNEKIVVVFVYFHTKAWILSQQREIDALRGEIGEMMANIAKRKENLQKELETQALIKQDIAGQRQRFEAVSKHLSCQINKAQVAYRDISKDIHHTERRKAELQRQLGLSKDSAARLTKGNVTIPLQANKGETAPRQPHLKRKIAIINTMVLRYKRK
ncbi:coiled-coil domain-containing protein 122 isoform X1 [Vanacampus margaritifer]